MVVCRRHHPAKRSASIVLQNNEKIVILGTVFNPSASNRSDLLLVRLNNPIATQTIKPQTASFALYPNPSAQSFVVDNPNTQNTPLSTPKAIWCYSKTCLWVLTT